MKIATLIANYLLALVFLVFGLEYFLHFMPKMEMPTGDAGAFFGILAKSNYMAVVKILEVGIGLCLAIGFKRPLMYVLLAPLIVNILLYEVLIAHQPGIGVALTLILAFLFYANRDKYQQLLNA